VLAALGRHLGAPIRSVSRLEFSLTALDSDDARTDRFGDALRLALLGALAAPALDGP
jgi:hypothetical protein